MKQFFILMLICSAAVCSNAAVFNFKGSPQPTAANANSDTWGVDVGVARQWFVAWISSAEMVYRNVIQTPNGTRRIQRLQVMDTVVFGAVSLLLLAAAGSAARSATTALAMRRQMSPVRNPA